MLTSGDNVVQYPYKKDDEKDESPLTARSEMGTVQAHWVRHGDSRF